MKRMILSLIPLLLATVNTVEAGSLKPLPAIQETVSYSNIEIERGHGAKDIFRHFVSECAPRGKVLFLATLRDGRHLRLFLLNGTEAAGYIETDGDGKYPWLLACEGTAKFLVEKEHQYGPGEARFHLYKGRALEGIDYAVNKPSAPTPMAAGMDEAAFSRKMASELAEYQMSFISTNQGTRFSGRFERGSGACDMVSVKRLTDNGATTRFKVCSGRVYALSGPQAPMMAAAE
jgi:hypothetical protein